MENDAHSHVCCGAEHWAALGGASEATLRYIDAGLTLAYIYLCFTSSTSLFKCSAVDMIVYSRSSAYKVLS